MFDFMFEQIKGSLLSKYGHLSYPELLDALRNDGFGELVNEREKYGMFEQLSDSMREFLPESGELGAGIMPSSGQHMPFFTSNKGGLRTSQEKYTGMGA